jgi:hypothetical protein
MLLIWPFESIEMASCKLNWTWHCPLQWLPMLQWGSYFLIANATSTINSEWYMYDKFHNQLNTVTFPGLDARVLCKLWLYIANWLQYITSLLLYSSSSATSLQFFINHPFVILNYSPLRFTREFGSIAKHKHFPFIKFWGGTKMKKTNEGGCWVWRD